MRILMLPAKRGLMLHEIKNFSGQWQYALHTTLTKLGHEVWFDQGVDVRRPEAEQIGYFQTLVAQLTGKDVDHVIGCSRYFSRVHSLCASMLKEVVRGAVTQIHDGPLAGQSTDTVFTIRNDSNRFMRGCTNIGWGADGEVLKPEQDRKTLRILIDHRLYRDGVDHTDYITKQALDFKREEQWRSWGYEHFLIRRFEDGGVVTITDESPNPPFTRQHVPFVEIAQEYNKAHVFFVTHHESLGLSVLESAMAGALVVAPVHFITTDRIATVRSLVINPNGDVPWDDVMDMIDIEASRRMASYQSWDAVVAKIVDYLEKFRRAR